MYILAAYQETTNPYAYMHNINLGPLARAVLWGCRLSGFLFAYTRQAWDALPRAEAFGFKLEGLGPEAKCESLSSDAKYLTQLVPAQ